MRKKLLVFLLLMACVMCQVLPVSAAGGVDISSLPNPPSDAVLISESDISVVNGENVLNGDAGIEGMLTYAGSTPYKIINVRADGTFWYSSETPYSWVDEAGVSNTEDVYEFKSCSSFDEAVRLAQTSVAGYSFGAWFDYDGYVVFVDGTTPKFKCSVAALADYAGKLGDLGLKKVDGDLTPSLSISVVEQLTQNSLVSGAKLRLTYNLPGYDWNGYVKDEHIKYVYSEPWTDRYQCETNETSGYMEFEIDPMYNITYTFWVKTDAGHKYPVEFAVNFITASDDIPYTGSYDAPVIKVVGMPTDLITMYPAPLMLTLVADMPVSVSWNGVSVSGGRDIEHDISVTENGVYHYVATSEIGVSTEGDVVVDFLSGAAYNMLGMDLVDSSGSLVQTGIEKVESNSSLGIVAIVGCCLVTLGGSLLYMRKRSGN